MKKRVVVQTHGMIVESDHPIAPFIDRFWTRPVLKRAHSVLYLTASERASIHTIEASARLTHLPNGVPEYEIAAGSQAVEVLFLARLHQRKRPLIFVEAALDVLSRGIDARFAIVGPDEGEGGRVRALIESVDAASNQIIWEGALDPAETVDRMRKSSIYVLPSVDEPFPMSVLEAMAVGLPVIVTDSCGLASVIRSSGGGIVVDDTKKSLADAIVRLANDSELRDEMGNHARDMVLRSYSMEAIGRALVKVYQAE